MENKVEDNIMDMEPPAFIELLQKPIVDQPLPTDFIVDDEAKHLEKLWNDVEKFKQYIFEKFVHAGGSGMVFRVKHKKTNTEQAIKIVRKKLIDKIDFPTDAAASLSPVSEHELLALEKLSHTNVVHLYDAIESKVGVIAISTTYVDNPCPLNLYFIKTLATHPDRSGRKGIHSFSPERLEAACDFLVKKIYEIASALKHMHDNGIYHFDVKPANILISGKHSAMLTDLGACVHDEQLQTGKKFRVHFTWTYAHPNLTTMINKPGSISGGGLKASAEISADENLQTYDMFALGRTIQEILAILEIEFGERCHAVYGFKFLHLIACLLLDGHNARSPEGRRVIKLHEIRMPGDGPRLPIEIT